MSYTKQTWQSGDVITAAKLNHIEDGVNDNKLPAVTSSDNGDVLTVVEGAWAKAASSGGGGSVVVKLSNFESVFSNSATNVYGYINGEWELLTSARYVLISDKDDFAILDYGVDDEFHQIIYPYFYQKVTLEAHDIGYGETGYYLTTGTDATLYFDDQMGLEFAFVVDGTGEYYIGLS